MVQRREVLRSLLAGSVVLCPVCLGLGRSARADTVHWTYHGEEGPEHWGELSPDFHTCSIGTQQSPIDLTGPVRVSQDGLTVNWQPLPLDHVVNNGHTIQVNCPPGSTIQAGGRSYTLLQFHFHHPSEHKLAGRAFPLEVHFVHRSEAGDLAVLGVFFTEGAENATLAPIWAAMPHQAGEADGHATVNPAALLPAAHDHFHYAGSLTTPPCSETVSWYVLRQPVEASAAQIGAFAALFDNNARPTQPVNRRFLLSDFD